MKIKFRTLVALIASASLMAVTSSCYQQHKEDKNNNSEMNQVKKEAKDVKEDAKKLGNETREMFTQRMQQRMDSVNYHLKVMQEKMMQTAGTMDMDAKARIDIWKEKASDLQAKLNEIKDTSMANWEEFKASVEMKMDTLENDIMGHSGDK